MAGSGAELEARVAATEVGGMRFVKRDLAPLL
jgi:hypothetical protein